jgi:hypothetical protein
MLRNLLIIFVFFVLFFAAHSALSQKKSAAGEICASIHRLIKDGKNTAQVVKAAIEVGASVRDVLRCALEAGGTLEDIIAGAMASGVSADVASSFLIEAGAEPRMVAEALRRSEAIVLESTVPEDIISGLPGGGGSAGITVSPSGF